jgi:hypothetical protein
MKRNITNSNVCAFQIKPANRRCFLGSAYYLAAFARRTSRFVSSNILRTMLAGVLLAQAHPAAAALSFGRGIPTAVGSVQFASSPDSVIITGALVGPGTINTALAIPANRIQFDVINSDQGSVSSWTLFYDPTVGPNIIGAFTPLGYITASGTDVPLGGYAYTTLFNAGFGVYSYNAGSPWSIDYEPDHITFIGTGAPAGLPANDGVGFLNPAPYLPSFAILYNPAMGNGLVPATAKVGSANLSGQVYGPLPGNPCLSIQCSNIVVETCNPCIPVTFSATAIDSCCASWTLYYNPPSGTCFPVGPPTPVQVIAVDQCGNTATNYFTVTVNHGPNCSPTNCITIDASNVVAYTCDSCTPVVYNVTATDNCCPASGVKLVFNPPSTTCFPQNSSTPVTVVAYDGCGNTNTSSFTVTVLPGPNCGNTNCIAIYQTNIVAYTCDSCTTVPFNTLVVDTCCPGVSLVYDHPTNTCFAVNTITPVQIMATDNCGNSVTKFITVTVHPGLNCNTNCISISCSNIVAYTCSNCINVPFTATAVDTCCPGASPTLVYSLPATYCFPQNSSTSVTVFAYDQCGNTNTSSFTVTVLPGPNCGPTNCISINCSNIVVYTCDPCTPVPYTATAEDNCCPGAPPTLVFSIPPGYCFPLNSVSKVKVIAYDQCGNAATTSFTVTVLPGSNCGGATPGFSITKGTNSGNGFIISWPATNAQLQQSSDLIHWLPIPGVTNSPPIWFPIHCR